MITLRFQESVQEVALKLAQELYLACVLPSISDYYSQAEYDRLLAEQIAEVAKELASAIEAFAEHDKNVM